MNISTFARLTCRSEQVVLVSAGFQGDIRTLQKLMQVRNVMYQHNHRRPMGVNALAQLLGNTLYYKRFFPHYTWNLTCGLDDKGELTLRGCQESFWTF